MTDRANSIEKVRIQDKRIWVSLLAFITGVLAASLVSIPPLISILFFVIAGVSYYLDREILIFLFVLFFFFGVLRYDVKDFHEIVMPSKTGIVVSEPEKRDTDIRFVVMTDNNEKVLVSTDLLSKVKYGDQVDLVGQFKLSSGPYGESLSKDDIYYTMSFAKVNIVSSKHGNLLVRQLLNLKNYFIARMRSILPEPESSLLAGLIVSGKQALDQNILNEFRRAGVVHIVVLSGYNITVIAEFLLLLFAFLGKKRAALVALLGVSLFVIMSGVEATVLRGAIMVLLAIGGSLFGRQGSGSRILVFTGAIMILLNPKILVYDTSFQLSFLAMAGLIFGAPIIQNLVMKILPDYKQASAGKVQVISWLVEFASATIATQLFVFPLILYEMGNFSTVFLVSNFFILPVIPIAMLFGFAATLMAFLSPIIAFPFSMFSHLLLKYILLATNFFSSFPFASIQIENFPWWGSLITYFVLVLSVWRLRKLWPSQSSLQLSAS